MDGIISFTGIHIKIVKRDTLEVGEGLNPIRKWIISLKIGGNSFILIDGRKNKRTD